MMDTSGRLQFFSSESMPASLSGSRNISEKSIIYQHDESFSSDYGEATEDRNNFIQDENRRISVSIMERVFNQNISSVLNKWYLNTNPENKLELVYEEARNN
jgi:hypothetical protein